MGNKFWTRIVSIFREKFKLDSDDLDEFHIPIKCLLLIGFQKEKLFKYSIMFYILQLLNFGCVAITSTTEGLYVTQNFDDIMEAAEAFTPYSIAMLTLSKYITFYIRRDKFYSLLEQIKNLSNECNSADLLKLKLVNNFDRKVGLAYLMSGTISTSNYCIVPMILNFVNVLAFEGEFKYILPFKAFVPWDRTETISYIFTYAMFFWSVYFSFMINVAVDSFFLGSCLNIGAHLDILRESFDGDKQKFMKRHEKILNLADSLKETIKPVIFVQFFITSMVLCVLGFQAVLHENTVNRLAVIFLSFAIIIQLFSYSYGGQLLNDKSSSIADHFYQTDKDLLIIIRRTLNPIVIKAGFYEATLPAFSAILRTAASLITLLQSFVK